MMFLIPESALEAFFDRSIERLLKKGAKGKHRLRQTLGDYIDVLTFQLRLVGSLSLSESMGIVLFEAGKKHTRFATEKALRLIRRLPGYRSFAESKDLEEARLSTEFTVLQKAYQSSREGILRLSEFEKDKGFVFQLEECADCYGIPKVEKSICYYTGGTLAGTMERVLNVSLGFVESKCYAKGDPCCEFTYRIFKR